MAVRHMSSSAFGRMAQKVPSSPESWTLLARFETVLLGERNLGQQVLEIVIFGYATPQEAEAALRRDVEAMIQT
jgi:hypothetical protein